MGRVVTNINNSLNISESNRQTQNNFSEQAATVQVGPAQTNSGTGESVAISNPTPTQINRWKVMTTADEGLKNALYDWVNTTKDGLRVAPDTTNGRTKKLTFNFSGNLGKSIKPAEIGEFNLIFSYSPRIVQPTTPVPTNDNIQA